MGVPARATVHLIAFLRLVAAEDIFEGTGHDVVNAWQTVGGGRAFVKDKLRALVADGLGKNVVFLPVLEDVALDTRQVQGTALGESLAHRAAMHFSSTAMGVGSESTSTVVRQGLGFTSAKYSAYKRLKVAKSRFISVKNTVMSTS